MDNLSTDKPAALYEAFKQNEERRMWERVGFTYTARHGSRLNIAETGLTELMEQ